MTIRKFAVTVTTNGSGVATAYSPYLSGYLCQIGYKKTDYADGVDFTITVEGTGQGLWTESDVNAAAVKAPRMAVASIVGVAATYDGTRPILDKVAISRDRVKIVLAQGGDTKTGVFEIIVDDGQ